MYLLWVHRTAAVNGVGSVRAAPRRAGGLKEDYSSGTCQYFRVLDSECIREYLS